MAISASGSNFTSGFTADNTVGTVTLPTDVPAGASIVVWGWGGTSLVSISDPVNGTWGTTPQDELGSSRGMFASYFANSAALTGSGNRTITVTFGSAGNKFFGAGWIQDDGGVATFQGYATNTLNAINTTDGHDSGTIALTGAGAIVALVYCNNNVTLTAQGAGESILLNAGSERVHAAFEAVASASTVGIELLASGNTDSRIALLGFLEPASAAVPAISSVTPSTVTPSSNLVIAGTNFEAPQGTGAVTISPTDNVADVNAVTATVGGGNWADTLITTTGTPFPAGTAHGATLYLFVTNASGETNAAGYVLTASVAPSLSNDGVIDATTDGFKLTWDTDTDSGTSAWALFATAELRNAWTVSGLPGALTEPANSVAWGTQAVTALGTQETALITGLGGGQTLYYRIYHYGDVTANGP